MNKKYVNSNAQRIIDLIIIKFVREVAILNIFILILALLLALT